MTMTDPIADLFTRIRNAGIARRNKVDIPHSILKESIARLLVREGFLREIQVSEVDDRKHIRAYLKTDPDGANVIQRIERMSKPGCRVYKRTRDIPRVLRGMGLGIFSTSKGVLSDTECREQRVGGEYVGRVW
ncbi:MAG: 30S ribosomal protein S8 [Planctomycetota bacterium]|jgi:small subunit ribosomal protein S8